MMYVLGMVYVPPKYPSEIPTIEDLPNRQDDVDWLVAARYNELKKELRACLTELGTLPKGEYADVKARLDAAAIGDKISEGDSSVEVIDTNGDGHVDIKTENVLCGKYHSDGIHDLPKQSGCKVYRSAPGKSIGTGSWTPVDLNTVVYDPQNEYDENVNYRFTAKKGGFYLVGLGVTFTTFVASYFVFLQVYKNGAGFVMAQNGCVTVDRMITNVFGAVSLAPNDYLDFIVYHRTGGAKTEEAGELMTWGSVQKVA